MPKRALPGLALLLVVVLGVAACRKTVTYPIYRRPVISSVVAFPTHLGLGDSTMITISATDPDGDPLVYDWYTDSGLAMSAFNGGWVTYRYNTFSPSMVFHRPAAWATTNDSASIWCAARDGRGGSDQRRVWIYFRN